MTKKRVIAVIVCIVVVFCVISFSENLTLRAAVFMYGHPMKAFTMEFREIKRQGLDGTFYVIDKNKPVEKSTQGELTTWVVYSFGPFHFAKYYGEG